MYPSASPLLVTCLCCIASFVFRPSMRGPFEGTNVINFVCPMSTTSHPSLLSANSQARVLPPLVCFPRQPPRAVTRSLPASACVLIVTAQYTPSGDEPPLPDKIAHYHTLYPLEDLSSSELSAAWGVRSSALKGLSARDGRAYVLRVVCGKQVIGNRSCLLDWPALG